MIPVIRVSMTDEATPTRRSRWERPLAVLAGCVAAVLLFELGLWAAGRLWGPSWLPSLGDRPTVVCLGDSFTQGVGAPEGADYPSALQRLMEEHGREVQVLNRGYSTWNTAQLLEHLPNILDRQQPEVITILIGGANAWNFIGYAGTELSLGELWSRSRLVRLARQVTARRATPAAPLRALVSTPGRKKVGAYAEALELYRGGQRDRALARLERAVDGDPMAPHRWDDLLRRLPLYRRALERFHEHWVTADAASPMEAAHSFAAQLAAVEKGVNFDDKGGVLPDRQRSEALLSARKALELDSGLDIELVLALLDLAPPGDDEVVTTTPANPTQWVMQDLSAMIDMAHARDVDVVVQSYPAGFPAYTGLSSRMLEIIAGIHGVPFVDQEAGFDALEEVETYFAPDGHCNTKGYELMARQLYPAVAELLDERASP